MTYDSVIIASKRKFATPVPQGYISISIDRSHPYLGNPFILKNANDSQERVQVIEHYRDWLNEKIAKNDAAVNDSLNQLVDYVESGKAIALLCWCHPKPCHGNIIKDVVLERLETRKSFNASEPGP